MGTLVPDDARLLPAAPQAGRLGRGHDAVGYAGEDGRRSRPGRGSRARGEIGRSIALIFSSV